MNLYRLIQHINPTRYNPMILYYHSVSDQALPYLQELFTYQDNSSFQAQIEWLLKNYKPLSWQTMLSLTRTNQKIPANSFLLSFDDGYRGVYENAFPLLKQYGLDAAVFPVIETIDNQAIFYRCLASLLITMIRQEVFSKDQLQTIQEYMQQHQLWKGDYASSLLALYYPQREKVYHIADLLSFDYQGWVKEHKPYMTRSELEELLQAGWFLGSHTITHPVLGQISTEQQRIECLESMRVLQEEFQLPYRILALPHRDNGLRSSFFAEMQQHFDLVIGGFGWDAYPNWHYYRRFTLEHFRKGWHTVPFCMWMRSILSRKPGC